MQAGFPDRLDCFGQIPLHPFRKYVACGPYSEIDAVEANLFRESGGFGHIGPL